MMSIRFSSNSATLSSSAIEHLNSQTAYNYNTDEKESFFGLTKTHLRFCRI